MVDPKWKIQSPLLQNSFLTIDLKKNYNFSTMHKIKVKDFINSILFIFIGIQVEMELIPNGWFSCRLILGSKSELKEKEKEHWVKMNWDVSSSLIPRLSRFSRRPLLLLGPLWKLRFMASSLTSDTLKWISCLSWERGKLSLAI